MRKSEYAKRVDALYAQYDVPKLRHILKNELNKLFLSMRASRAKDRNSQPPRNYTCKPSKYVPHQGARECERRRIGGFASPRFDALIRNQLIINTQRSSLNPLI